MKKKIQKKINPTELYEEVKKYGLFNQIDEIATPKTTPEKIKPILPLTAGHLAQIIASGLMNGIVFDKNNKNPLLVKGTTKKVTNSTVEISEMEEIHIERETLKIVIKGFNNRGCLLVID